MLRVVFDGLRHPQPDTDLVRELADHDLRFLISYLSDSRDTTYSLSGRPDEEQSERPAPDYLIRESPSGRVIAIEHTLLMQQDLQAAIARRIKEGAKAVATCWRAIDPAEIGQALEIAVKRKLARGQLQNIDADERILLIHNRMISTEETYLEASVHFSHQDKSGIDHAYLIVSSRLLELW